MPFHLPWIEKCLCTIEHAFGTTIPGLDPAGITVFFQETRFPGPGMVSEETFQLAGLMLKY